MSLQDIYKEAGVVMKPAAMKSGKLYSQQPHSGAGDFNFSRADGVQTRINKHGLIETVANNEPRLSYDIVDGKVSDCPHLLLEPSRINSLLQSNQFDTTWYNSNTSESVSSGGFGGLDYWTITKTAASGWIRQNLSLSGVQTLSVYAKSGTLNWIRIIATGSSTASTWFDLQSGVVGSADFDTESSNIESVGDGWYRCSITVDIGTVNGVRFYPADGNNDVSGTSGSVLIQAAQLESGSYETSYIPTSGSTETRQADICNGSGNSETFNDSEGVLFVNAAALHNDGTYRTFSINNGATTNSILIGYANTSNKIIAETTVSGTKVQTNTVAVANAKDFNKMAIKYKLNDYSLYVNGSELATDPIASVPIGLNELGVDRGDGLIPFYGKIKELTVINEALTDEQLQLLTTP